MLWATRDSGNQYGFADLSMLLVILGKVFQLTVVQGENPIHDPNHDHMTRVLPNGRSSDLVADLPHGGLGTSSFQQNIVSGENPGRDPVASVKV